MRKSLGDVGPAGMGQAVVHFGYGHEKEDQKEIKEDKERCETKADERGHRKKGCEDQGCQQEEYCRPEDQRRQEIGCTQQARPGKKPDRGYGDVRTGGTRSAVRRAIRGFAGTLEPRARKLRKRGRTSRRGKRVRGRGSERRGGRRRRGRGRSAHARGSCGRRS